MLATSTAALIAYHAVNFPAIGQGWPLVVALYSCAALGRLRARPASTTSNGLLVTSG